MNPPSSYLLDRSPPPYSSPPASNSLSDSDAICYNQAPTPPHSIPSPLLTLTLPSTEEPSHVSHDDHEDHEEDVICSSPSSSSSSFPASSPLSPSTPSDFQVGSEVPLLGHWNQRFQQCLQVNNNINNNINDNNNNNMYNFCT